MGIPLDEVWEMPALKKLAYGEHLSARDQFEAHCQRIARAQQEEDFDLDEIADGMDVDIPTGGQSMPNMPNMGNMSNMPNVGGMSKSGASGGSDIHPALRKYANSKSGKIVNVTGDDDGDDG